MKKQFDYPSSIATTPMFGKVSIAGIILVLSFQPAYACVSPPPPTLCELLPDSICFVAKEVKKESNQDREITVASSFVTFGSSAGDSCAAIIGGISGANITAIDILTFEGDAFEGFNFVRNDRTAKSLTLAGAETEDQYASGFSSKMSAPIPAGIWVQFAITFKPEKGTDPDELLRAAQKMRFAMGSADSEGRLDGRHLKAGTLSH